MTWPLDGTASPLAFATAVANFVRAMSDVRWEGLPGWQTLYRVEVFPGQAVQLLLWPEPTSS